ncbi:kinesin-like protein KIF1B [Platysternon megacephalum]|uniref:Kinesin-like protein KIF1B n=1 Tax=Platysternon megacephalum TaxID=55544 RepID=A0A4D9F0B6_9SAUR|nr:kinesin-like protein KIF1B [Platysternon megacephalum]
MELLKPELPIFLLCAPPPPCEWHKSVPYSCPSRAESDSLRQADGRTQLGLPGEAHSLPFIPAGLKIDRAMAFWLSAGPQMRMLRKIAVVSDAWESSRLWVGLHVLSCPKPPCILSLAWTPGAPCPNSLTLDNLLPQFEIQWCKQYTPTITF